MLERRRSLAVAAGSLLLLFAVAPPLIGVDGNAATAPIGATVTIDLGLLGTLDKRTRRLALRALQYGAYRQWVTAPVTSWYEAETTADRIDAAQQPTHLSWTMHALVRSRPGPTCAIALSFHLQSDEGMKTVDAVDGEIRFLANWGGRDRFVFIPDPYVSQDAGWAVSRAEAIQYVQENLDRYREEARAQHGDDNPEKIVIIHRQEK